MSYKWLNGYKSSLDKKISSQDGLLSIPDAKALAESLGPDHTYLTINDGTGAEIIKAISFGNEIKIERGQDGTSAKAFPAGSCVQWEVTKIGLTETVCNKEFDCQLEKCECKCDCK